VQEVIQAAYGAFYAGLRAALVLSAVLVLAAGLFTIAMFGTHAGPRRPTPPRVPALPHPPGAPSRGPGIETAEGRRDDGDRRAPSEDGRQAGGWHRPRPGSLAEHGPHRPGDGK
jgi:hypothetical protein